MAGSEAVEPRFARVVFGSPHPATLIGGGEVGGKAKGLFFARDLIAEHAERLRQVMAAYGLGRVEVKVDARADG